MCLEIYDIFEEASIIDFIKTRWLQWLGHLDTRRVPKNIRKLKRKRTRCWKEAVAETTREKQIKDEDGK